MNIEITSFSLSLTLRVHVSKAFNLRCNKEWKSGWGKRKAIKRKNSEKIKNLKIII